MRKVERNRIKWKYDTVECCTAQAIYWLNNDNEKQVADAHISICDKAILELQEIKNEFIRSKR